jgi:hypothetical protein
MAYDNMKEYAVALHNVFKLINKRARDTSNNKMGQISIMIYNYYVKIVTDNKFVFAEIERTDVLTDVNLMPIFEYISHNNVELYDFSTIDLADVDASKNEDIERFVLTHIYYLTQK